MNGSEGEGREKKRRGKRKGKRRNEEGRKEEKDEVGKSNNVRREGRERRGREGWKETREVCIKMESWRRPRSVEG